MPCVGQPWSRDDGNHTLIIAIDIYGALAILVGIALRTLQVLSH